MTLRWVSEIAENSVSGGTGIEAKGQSEFVWRSHCGIGTQVFFPFLKCPHSHFNVFHMITVLWRDRVTASFITTHTSK